MNDDESFKLNRTLERIANALDAILAELRNSNM